jgi:hypothetical protein
MKYWFLAILLGGLSQGSALASTLTYSLGADDYLLAYLSTQDNTLGTITLLSSPGSGSVSLTPGETYYVHIESLNWGGAGGFVGSLSTDDSSLLFENGTTSLDTSAANAQYWRASYGGTISFGDRSEQPWVPATGQAVYESPAPYPVIWPSDSQSSPNGYYWNGQCTDCYVTFSTTITGVSSAPEPANGILLGAAALGLFVVRRGSSCLKRRLGNHRRVFESRPHGVQWMRFESDCPFPEIVRTMPHVAFEVDDLALALERKEIPIQPNSPAEGLSVAMIIADGAPVEALKFTPYTNSGKISPAGPCNRQSARVDAALGSVLISMILAPACRA